MTYDSHNFKALILISLRCKNKLCDLLLRHPSRVLKCQLGTTDFVLEEIDVLAELADGIQGSVMEETKATHLGKMTNVVATRKFNSV